MRGLILAAALVLGTFARADSFHGKDAQELYSLLKKYASVNGDATYRTYHISTIRCRNRDDRRVANCTFYDANAFGRGPRLSVTGMEGKQMMLILGRNFPWTLSADKDSLRTDAVRCYLEGLGKSPAVSRFYACTNP